MMLHIGAFIVLRILTAAFFITLIARIAVGLRRRAGRFHERMMFFPGVEILQKRFARGEISSAEYTERLEVLTKQS